MDRLNRNTHRSVEEKKIHFFACGLLLAATPFFRERAGNQVENNELVGFVSQIRHCFALPHVNSIAILTNVFSYCD